MHGKIEATSFPEHGTTGPKFNGKQLIEQRVPAAPKRFLDALCGRDQNVDLAFFNPLDVTNVKGNLFREFLLGDRTLIPLATHVRSESFDELGLLDRHGNFIRAI